MAQGTINTLCCGACTDTGSLAEVAAEALNSGHCGNYMEVLSNYAAQPGNVGTGSVVLHYCSSDPNCGCEVAAIEVINIGWFLLHGMLLDNQVKKRSY